MTLDDSFNEMVIKSGMRAVKAEVVVAHRLGYYYGIDLEKEPLTRKEIQDADDLLEYYVQKRIEEDRDTRRRSD